MSFVVKFCLSLRRGKKGVELALYISYKEPLGLISMLFMSLTS